MARTMVFILIAIAWLWIGFGFFETFAALSKLVGGQKYIKHTGAGPIATIILLFGGAACLSAILLLLCCTGRIQWLSLISRVGTILVAVAALYWAAMHMHLPFVPIYTSKMFSSLLLAVIGCGVVTIFASAYAKKTHSG